MNWKRFILKHSKMKSRIFQRKTVSLKLIQCFSVAVLLPALTVNINTLKGYFLLSENAEITLEANPKTFDRNKLLHYKESGVNRLSIGLQSANSESLKTLGRIHSLSEFEKSYFLAREAGFSNINIDIMYGLPDEKKEILKKTVETLKDFNPEHISAYALTLGVNTPLYKMKLNYPDEDSIFENYMMICEMLSDYRHYEISNFGNIPCRHNLIYWNRDEYLGFGAAASGFFGNTRYTNKSEINSYIDDFFDKESIENLTEADELFEYVMLALRTDNGIDCGFLKEKYSYDLYAKNKEFIDFFVKEGYMKKSDKGFFLTDKGFFVSNSIISSLEINN